MDVARKRRTIHLIVILSYALLALALTWPLVSGLSSQVPGDGVDDPPLTWNLWWVRYSLLERGGSPFDSDYLFYPLGINLAFYTLTLLNGLLSIPLQAVLGLVAASNVLLLSSFVLSGYGAYLLALFLLRPGKRHENANHGSPLMPLYASAFTAGILYAFASSKLFYAALGQWNISSSQWIPFYILYLFKMTGQPRNWRFVGMSALFLLFQAYAELTFATFLVLFTGLWVVWQAMTHIRAGQTQRLYRLFAGLLLVGLLFAVGLVPVLAAMIPDMLIEGDILAEGGGFTDAFSADLVGFLVPTMLHPLFGSAVEMFSFDHSVGQHLYLGFSVLAAALLGVFYGWRRSSAPDAASDSGSGEFVPRGLPGLAKYWSVSAIVFWLLTLGPTLRINGHDSGVPMPFALLAEMPLLKGNRYPSRYSVLLMLSLAILAAYGMLALLQKRQFRHGSLRLFAPAALVFLILFEHLSAPLPMSDMRVPTIYATLASELPEDSTLLDLPVAWRNGSRVTGTAHPIIMFEQYYQSVHGRRILAGNTSRNPPLKFQYFTEAPVINTLIALETGHTVEPATIERDRDLATDVLRFFNIRGVAVHPDQSGEAVVRYVEEVMPVERCCKGDGTVAYWVDNGPLPAEWTIDPGGDLSRLSYAEGWGEPANSVIWAQRRRVRLLVPLNGESQVLDFVAFAPQDGQQVEVMVNGEHAASIAMYAGWMDYGVQLPSEAVTPGLNEIWLRFSDVYPASQPAPSKRSIGSTGTESPVNIVVQSAGQEIGDYGLVFIDGRNASPDERGYNVVVVDPLTGRVEGAAGFDTHLDPEASGSLARFIGDVPTGHIVAVAAADEASRLLGQEAVEALRGIGATVDLRDQFRWGHALIGVQGAEPGSAVESTAWMRPVSAVVGEGATEPKLAVGFGRITFRASGRP
ncbi:interleukin-like EMT inducer domain-containing protein [Chloroflexota bacterium]